MGQVFVGLEKDGTFKQVFDIIETTRPSARQNDTAAAREWEVEGERTEDDPAYFLLSLSNGKEIYLREGKDGKPIKCQWKLIHKDSQTFTGKIKVSAKS